MSYAFYFNLRRYAKEVERRPEAVALARSFADLAAKTLDAFNDTKPWITEEEKEALTADVAGFTAWLDEKLASQEKMKVTESPAFSASEVMVALKPLEGKLAGPYTRSHLGSI